MPIDVIRPGLALWWLDQALGALGHARDAGGGQGVPTVTAVVVAWGPSPHLSRCVSSILRSEGADVDLVVVDNGCPEDVLRSLPDDGRVHVLTADRNLGFGGGCNLGVTKATGDVLVFVNPDAVVSPVALSSLANVLEDPGVGIATARLRLMDEPDLLNSSGGVMHFLGFGWAEDFEKPAASVRDVRPVTGASGAAMAMRTKVFDELGGFTPEFFLYQEDLELSLRTWMSGRSVVLVPDADVWHDYSFSRNPEKYYYVERNRLLLVVSLYEKTTLILLAPALIALELGMLLLAARQRWFVQKVRGWHWIICNRRWILSHRQAVQAARNHRDSALAPLLASRFDARQVNMPLLARPIDWLLGKYWRVASRCLPSKSSRRR